MNLIGYRGEEALKTFLGELDQKDYLDGLFLNVAMTKDGVLVVTSGENYPNHVIDLQNQNLSEMPSESVVPLEEALRLLGNTQKLIFLHLMAVYRPYSDIDLNEIIRLNEVYLAEVERMVTMYPVLYLYLCSMNHYFLRVLKEKQGNYSVGVIMEEGNLNFIDVDFYITGASMVNPSIFQMLLSNQKEIYVSLNRCQEMANLMEYYGMDVFSRADPLFSKLSYISYYPEILSQLIYPCATTTEN